MNGRLFAGKQKYGFAACVADVIGIMAYGGWHRTRHAIIAKVVYQLNNLRQSPILYQIIKGTKTFYAGNYQVELQLSNFIKESKEQKFHDYYDSVKIIARCAVIYECPIKKWWQYKCKALIRKRNECGHLTHILPMSLHLNCILFCRILALQLN